MLENGWIKLHRSLLKWEWYDDINTKTVFLHLLLTVSIEDSKWHGIEVKRGSRVISYSKLAKETRLSIDQVRTVIKHLESTGEITRLKYAKFTVISLNNYDKFQEVPSATPDNYQSSPKQVPISSQSNPNSIRRYKKEKEDKEYIFADKPPAQPRKSFTPPTVEEVKAYCTERNNGIDAEHFVDYYTSNGWKVGKNQMKDWKAAVRTWERNSQQNQKQNQPTEGSALSGKDSRIYEGII